MIKYNNYIIFADGRDSREWPLYDKRKSMALPSSHIFTLTLLNIGEMNQTEIWKPVVGLEDYYMISNIGRIKSVERTVIHSDGRKRNIGGKILKTRINNQGYECIKISCNRQKKEFKIHRMVALAFIPNVENKPHIDHINTIRSDNRVENLKWVTRLENAHNPITYSRMFGRNHAPAEKILKRKNENKSYGAEKAVVQLSANGDIIKEFKSIRDAGRAFHNSGSAISCCCRKMKCYKTAHGYVWRYKDEYEKEYMVAREPEYLAIK